MNSYDVELGYLSYESTSDKISIEMRIRERHLTPETTDARLQAIGSHLQVTLRSERDDIHLRIPLTEWRWTDAYNGTLTGANDGILSVGRFEDWLPDDDGRIKATIEVTNNELLR